MSKSETLNYRFGDKHIAYMQRCRINTINVAEGLFVQARRLTMYLPLPMNLKLRRIKYIWLPEATAANAKLNIGVCNGYGLEGIFSRALQMGKIQRQRMPIYTNTHGEKVVIFSGAAKADSYKKSGVIPTACGSPPKSIYTMKIPYKKHGTDSLRQSVAKFFGILTLIIQTHQSIQTISINLQPCSRPEQCLVDTIMSILRSAIMRLLRWKGCKRLSANLTPPNSMVSARHTRAAVCSGRPSISAICGRSGQIFRGCAGWIGGTKIMV